MPVSFSVAVHHQRLAVAVGRRADRRRKAEPGEDPRQPGHVGRAISLDRRTAARLRRAIRVELVEAEREQLHQLARIILVGDGAGRAIGLLVAEEGQERRHRRIGRDRVEQCAIIAERIVHQHVDVGGGGELLPVEVHAADSDDQHVEQRHPDALTQLVGLGDHLAPHRRVESGLGIDVGGDVIAVGDQPIPVRGRTRQRELVVDPSREAAADHRVDRRARRAHAGLREKAAGLCGRHTGGHDHDRRAGDRRGRAALASSTCGKCQRKRRRQSRSSPPVVRTDMALSDGMRRFGARACPFQHDDFPRLRRPSPRWYAITSAYQ